MFILDKIRKSLFLDKKNKFLIAAISSTLFFSMFSFSFPDNVYGEENQNSSSESKTVDTSNLTESEYREIVGISEEITIERPEHYVNSISDTVSVVSDGYAVASCNGTKDPTVNESYSVTCSLKGNIQGKTSRVTPSIISFSGIPEQSGLQTQSQDVKVEVQYCSKKGCYWEEYPTTTITYYMNPYEGLTNLTSTDSFAVTNMDESLGEFDVDSLTNDSKYSNGETGGSSGYISSENSNGATIYQNSSENANTSIGKGIMNGSNNKNIEDTKGSISEKDFDQSNSSMNDLLGDESSSLNNNYNDSSYTGTSNLDSYFNNDESDLGAGAQNNIKTLDLSNIDFFGDNISSNKNSNIINSESANGKGERKDNNVAFARNGQDIFVDIEGNEIDGYFDASGAWVGEGDPSKIAGIKKESGKIFVVDYLPGAYGKTYAARADEESGRWAVIEAKVFSVFDMVDFPLVKNSAGTLMDGSLADLFGDILGGMDFSAFNKTPTLTNQQLYEVAKQILLKKGYHLEELQNGINYDKGSAYTDSDHAWDFNRITKLISDNQIQTDWDSSRLK